jgi:hypothetical protein
MNLKYATGLALAICLAAASPALAKSHNVKIKGVYCEQGGQNVFFPASSIKASIRNKLRKGQKFKFNYPGFGPI